MRSFITCQTQPLGYIPISAEYSPEVFSASHLKLRSSRGDTLALYHKDIHTLSDHARDHFDCKLEQLTPAQLLDAIKHSGVKLVQYFNAEHRAQHLLDTTATHFAKAGSDIVDVSGNALSKTDEHQNCIAMIDDRIYIHPKQRASVISDSISIESRLGINHTSLTAGKPAQFVGSLIYKPSIGWILENTTGHYRTRPHHLHAFVRQLAAAGLDLSELNIRCWIPKTERPSASEDDYTILVENAVDFLERKHASIRSCDMQLQRRQQQLTQIKHALQSPDLDSSDYFILLHAYTKHYACAKQHPDLMQLATRYYLTNQPKHGIAILHKMLCGEMSEHDFEWLKAIHHRTIDNPSKQQSRRFFEYQLSMQLCDSLQSSHFDSLTCLVEFARRLVKPGIEPMRVSSVDDSIKALALLRQIGDDSADILSRQDGLRAASKLYQRKDRGSKKPTSFSCHPSICRSSDPLPPTELHEARENRVPDLCSIDASVKRGFSKHHPSTPFVNSVSGSAYTLVIMLEAFVETQPDIERDTLSTICHDVLASFVAIALKQGWHSLVEVITVFEQPEVKVRLARHGLDLDLRQLLPLQAADTAIQRSTEHTLHLCQHRRTLEALIATSHVAISGIGHCDEADLTPVPPLVYDGSDDDDAPELMGSPTGRSKP